MPDWVERLFSADGFVPRAKCGEAWTADLVADAQLADGMVAVAYTFIPALLAYVFMIQRGRARYVGVALLFGAFILLCGLTHWLQVLMFDYPAYRLLIVTTKLTGYVSIVTAGVLAWVVWRLRREHGALELLEQLTAEKEAARAMRQACDRLQADLAAQANLLAAERGRSDALERANQALLSAACLTPGQMPGQIAEVREKVDQIGQRGPDGGGAGRE